MSARRVRDPKTGQFSTVTEKSPSERLLGVSDDLADPVTYLDHEFVDGPFDTPIGAALAVEFAARDDDDGYACGDE